MVVIAPPFGVAEDFECGVQRLGLLYGGGGIRIEIGMVLFCQHPVGGTNLGISAAPVKTERGVMIGFGALQGLKILNRWDVVSAKHARRGGLIGRRT